MNRAHVHSLRKATPPKAEALTFWHSDLVHTNDLSQVPSILKTGQLLYSANIFCQPY